MSKVFTEIPIHALRQVKSEDLNKNAEKYLGAFNGNLDGHNMPVDAIDTDNFVLLTEPAADQTGTVNKVSSRGPTQAYYDSYRASWVAADIWTPLTQIDLTADDWRRGWNRLDSWTNWGDFPITFDAQEGMLVGCATIDWHHGINRVSYSDGQDTFTIWTGHSWWTEWGVFVNNILVARSGEIYPRRHTTSLPFSIPTGSQNVKIDVRFITVSGKNVLVTGDPTTNLDIFSAEIWVRNQFR